MHAPLRAGGPQGCPFPAYDRRRRPGPAAGSSECAAAKGFARAGSPAHHAIARPRRCAGALPASAVRLRAGHPQRRTRRRRCQLRSHARSHAEHRNHLGFAHRRLRLSSLRSRRAGHRPATAGIVAVPPLRMSRCTRRRRYPTMPHTNLPPGQSAIPQPVHQSATQGTTNGLSESGHLSHKVICTDRYRRRLLHK